ncbi:M23 family metallopeptidase [Herpetosiphon llansteffanensis]
MRCRQIGWLVIVVFVALIPLNVQATIPLRMNPEFSVTPMDTRLDHSDPSVEAAIWHDTNHAIAMLEAQNKLPKPTSPSQVSLTWPLRYVGNNPSIFNYYAIGYFVDHNPVTGLLRDYMGGERTYDTSAYRHNGVDIQPWPFPMQMMDSQAIQAVAAAPGIIVYRADGYYDRNCALQAAGVNMVNIRHSDGTITRYAHLKKGSVTYKQVGDRVDQGEYLGLIGSSGNSSGPHLHFDVYVNESTVIDPFQGPSNPTTTTSWWVAQRPYWNSTLNRLMTSSEFPDDETCPNPEKTYESLHFNLGSTVRFLAYYSDQRPSQTTTYTIKRPDGTIFTTWTHAPPWDFFIRGWGWSHLIPDNEQPGIWIFSAEYLNTTYSHRFTMGNFDYAVYLPNTQR